VHRHQRRVLPATRSPRPRRHQRPSHSKPGPRTATLTTPQGEEFRRAQWGNSMSPSEGRSQ
jgi:hypothetical protein